MYKLSFTIIASLCLCLVSVFSYAEEAGAKKPKRPGFQTNDFRISLTARTTNQTIAFYTGRGFPNSALDELKHVCFITIGIQNKGTKRVWYDLDNWNFTTEDGPVKRRLRHEWTERWDKIGMQKRFQSTFRWTLLPEKMGLYAHEGEGGNVTLIKTDKSITVTGTIVVGEADPLSYPIKIKNVYCERDQ